MYTEIFSFEFLNISRYFYNYVNLFWFTFFAVIFSIALYLLNVLLTAMLIQHDNEKVSTYECGFIPFSDARMTFNVGFYIVSLLFIVFDLEIVFLFPLSKIVLLIGNFGFFSVVFFFFVLTIGFVFEWTGGALDL